MRTLLEVFMTVRDQKLWEILVCAADLMRGGCTLGPVAQACDELLDDPVAGGLDCKMWTDALDLLGEVEWRQRQLDRMWSDSVADRMLEAAQRLVEKRGILR